MSEAELEAAAADGNYTGTFENEIDIIYDRLEKDSEIEEPSSSSHVVVDKVSDVLIKTETSGMETSDTPSGDSSLVKNSDDQDEVTKLLAQVSRMEQ